MPDPDPRPTRHVPARDLPIPASLSPEAQVQMAFQMPQGPPYPPLDDHDAWRARIAMGDESILPAALDQASKVAADVEEIQADGARVYVANLRAKPANDRAVFLDVHGGALIMCGGEICRAWASSTAKRVGARVWSVDYRMPPEHPYPAGLDDCVAAYRALLRERRPEEIIIGGASAGGNLAAALILRARDEGLPLPAAAVLLTPEVDLTESGDSFNTNLGVDSILGRLMPANLLYAGGHDLSHPYLSPLFADFAKGFPPTFLSTGTRDLFLSNTVRMHRALRNAGVAAELHVLEAASHGGFPGTPEGEDLDREIRRFVQAHWR